MNKSILVIGYKGQLGTELRLRLEQRSDCMAQYVDRDELDITNESAVNDFFLSTKIDYCINCAAYNDVEGAEKNEDAARAINATAVGIVARACKSADATLFHISTDFVFDGRKSDLYVEDDEPNPLSVYAKTKHEGEQEALENNVKTFILRTAWLYSPYGKNFVKTMLRLGKERETLDVVCDQVGSPTCAGDLAGAIISILDCCADKTSKNLESLYGIYHFTNNGVASWYDFAKSIMEYAGLACRVEPIMAEKFPSSVRRPHFSALNLSKIKERFDIAPPHWRESLKNCVQ